MKDETLFIPESEPYKLSDFWSLLIVGFAGLLIWQGIVAQPGDTATMLGMGQRTACFVLAGILLLGICLILRRNKRIFNRYFTNKNSRR